jgi:hypothetical protein
MPVMALLCRITHQSQAIGRSGLWVCSWYTARGLDVVEHIALTKVHKLTLSALNCTYLGSSIALMSAMMPEKVLDHAIRFSGNIRLY